MPARHTWTWEDDLVVLYVYRFGIDKLDCEIKDLAEARGITVGSFNARLKNFAALDGKSGLDHAANISKEVYDQHSETDEKTLRGLAFPDLR
jgi:hypothetical protein